MFKALAYVAHFECAFERARANKRPLCARAYSMRSPRRAQSARLPPRTQRTLAPSAERRSSAFASRLFDQLAIRLPFAAAFAAAHMAVVIYFHSALFLVVFTQSSSCFAFRCLILYYRFKICKLKMYKCESKRIASRCSYASSF